MRAGNNLIQDETKICTTQKKDKYVQEFMTLNTGAIFFEC